MQAPDFYSFADRLTSPSGQWEGDLMACTLEGQGGGRAVVVQCKGKHRVRFSGGEPAPWILSDSIRFDRPTDARSHKTTTGRVRVGFEEVMRACGGAVAGVAEAVSMVDVDAGVDSSNSIEGQHTITCMHGWRASRTLHHP